MESNSVLISIIWLYETNRVAGTVIGPLIPLVTKSLHLHINGWKIDQFNIANVVMALAYFIVLCVCQAKVCNVSKIYDQMFHHSKDNDSKVKQDLMEKPPTSTTERKVMNWKSLFQIDILSVVLSVSLGRYASTICNLVVIATKFSWTSEKVYPLTMTSSIVFLALLSIINRIGLFNSKPHNIFFIFVASLILMAGTLNTVLLTATNLFSTFNRQLVYLAILRLCQSFCWFQINTLGNFLLFYLVDPKDSSFVTGFRGLMSSLIKSIAQGLEFTTVYHPEYYVPWIVIALVALPWLFLWRRYKYLD